MDDYFRELIDRTKDRVLSGHVTDRKVLKEFLSLPTDSEECLYLRGAARSVRDELYGNYVSINTAIGLDWAPCKGDCSFCSFGSRWGLVKDSILYTDDEILDIVKGVYSKGYRSFTLRTTEFYDFDRLLTLGRKIGAMLPKKDFRLGVNTGELTTEQCNELYECGYSSAYHMVRLREGVDTPFDPEVRLRTMHNIHRSKLKLGASIDPLGVEHTDDEILDKMYFIEQFGLSNIGVMRRICVPGTPKGEYPIVSDDRMAQIVAALRMYRRDKTVSGAQTSRQVLQSGSCSMTVEIGASPRRCGMINDRWYIMDHDEAQQFIKDAGCVYGTPKPSFMNDR